MISNSTGTILQYKKYNQIQIFKQKYKKTANKHQYFNVIGVYQRKCLHYIMVQSQPPRAYHQISIKYKKTEFQFINNKMDVVFHRNCMDGAYSAHLLYLLCKTLTIQGYNALVSHFKSHNSNCLQGFCSQNNYLNEFSELNEEFFHTGSIVKFHSVSMYAGDLFPISPSQQGNILIMVDISPQSYEILQLYSTRFAQVIIFDHHTSFASCLTMINQKGFKNVLYLWDQTKCAAKILEEYLFKGFGFPKNLPVEYQKQLQQQLKYVNSNDMKIDQNPLSKQFTLGFYYFELELSHQNPLLFKRLWQLKIDTIFAKGKSKNMIKIDAYKNHIEMLKRQIEFCQLWKLKKAKVKDIQFLAASTNDRGLISDLGSLLAHYSMKLYSSNLGMIYKKSHNDARISFRSHQSYEAPKALQISQIFGGGGHVHAAGCHLSKSTFNQNLQNLGALKPKIKASSQQIQNILFMSENLKIDVQ